MRLMNLYNQSQSGITNKSRRPVSARQNRSGRHFAIERKHYSLIEISAVVGDRNSIESVGLC